MLDFGEKIYQQVLDFCALSDLEANFSEYPLFGSDVKEASAAEILPRLRRNFKTPNFPMGLYIHVPFCQNRCLFCRYYSEETGPSDDIVNEYLDALEKQLEMYESGGIDFSRVNLRNLYLGGGTPTLLSEEQLGRLFGVVRHYFKFDSKKIQVSCEATPQSITQDKARLLRRLGVNRVSLGVESFDEDVLKLVGRKQTVQDVFRAANAIRESGIRYLSIDLIVGLPGETVRTYQKTIRETLKLGPEAVEIFKLLPSERMKTNRAPAIGISADDIMKMFRKGLSSKYRVYLSAVTLDLIKKGAQIRKAVNANQRWILALHSSLGLGPSGLNVFPNVKFVAESNIGNYINHFKYGNNQKFFRVQFLTEGDRKRNFIITSIAVARWVDKKKYFESFNSPFERDFRREIGHLKKIGVVSETRNKFIWHLKNSGVGYKSYFPHVLRYWYHSKYIRRFLKQMSIS